ncbi:MAG: IS4 family transposase [Chloroflexota bacterium]|nr:IS4 family transposase [Chloroflexota bacterium]
MSIVPAPDPQTRSETLDAIEQFLMELIALCVPSSPPAGGRGRPRILPSLCLWSGVVLCVLRGLGSQRDIWRLLAKSNLWDYPRFTVSDQAVYTRLANGGTGPLETLLDQISAVLRDRLAPLVTRDLAPFATEVVALDETTLEQVSNRLPSVRAVPPGDKARIPGKLAGMFDIRRQQWRAVSLTEDWHENEKVRGRLLIPALPAGSLVLADLGYFAFAWFDELADAGRTWISRFRARTSSKRIHTYYEDGDTLDALVWLGAYRADRTKHAVRLMQFRQKTVLHRYIANMVDPQVLPLQMIAELYARRWDFELAVDLIKTQEGVHLLWSSKPVVVQQQVLAALIIAQILQALRIEAAVRAGVDTFEVSMRLLIRYLPFYAQQSTDPIGAFLACARETGCIRPSKRTIIQTPAIDLLEFRPLPPDLVLVRTPKYAQRKCGPVADRNRTMN